MSWKIQPGKSWTPHHFPMVSIVMPVLNPHPIYFRQAVQSVLEQTFDDFELLIIENPASDGSVSVQELLKGWNDPRIMYYVQPHRTSLVEQRNRGLVEARAQLVALLDADDICKPDRLQKQVYYLTTHPDIGVLGSQVCIIDRDGKLQGYRSYPLDHPSIVHAMQYFNPLANPSVMYRKDTVVKAGGYQYTKYPANEDYDLWCRLATRGVRFANYAEPLIYYRIHPQGMKTAKLRGIIRGTLEIKRKYWHDQMCWGAKARKWAEHLLLLLPPELVLKLFIKTQYVNHLPVHHRLLFRNPGK